MSYKIASIDIHKKVLMVVVASTAAEVADAAGAAVEFERRKFGAGADQRNQVVRWLQHHPVLEAVLEGARIKLSSVISDLLGVSGGRILTALAKGESDPVKLAELGDDGLKCTKEQLADALKGSPAAGHIELLKLHLERLHLLDKQIEELIRMSAKALMSHQNAVVRVAKVPGFGVESAQQMIAEVAVDAEGFPSAGEVGSSVGWGSGSEVRGGQNDNGSFPDGT